MKATEILSEEHRVIERVLVALERAAKKLGNGEDFRPGYFEDAADFVKGFADGCHHKKEEGVLFPAMQESGVAVEGGPIGVMLAEHEQGRNLISGMRSAAQRLGEGDQAARDEIVANALNYVTLLRQHIMKEDKVLFPMADRVVPLARRDQLTEDFDHIEHVETGEGVHERFLALAEALEAESLN